MNLEHRFTENISGNLLHFRQMPNGTYKFQCPYCQRGARHKSGRAWKDRDCASYFYERDGALNFSCYKCGTKRQFHNFLKDHFPNQFIAYVKEREQRGTTGKGYNCPTLANALESIGNLKFEKPVFNVNSAQENSNGMKEDKETPSTSNSVEDHSANNRDSDFIIHEGRRYKRTIHPPATTPQALAVHGAPINRIMNRRERMRRQRRGDLW